MIKFHRASVLSAKPRACARILEVHALLELRTCNGKYTEDLCKRRIQTKAREPRCRRVPGSG